MKKRTKKIAIIYGAWVLFWILITLYGELFYEHSEYAISAHLWLSLTGAPLSLVSWFIHPHGTIIGVIVAGLLGVIQWCVLAELTNRKKKPNKLINRTENTSALN